MDEHDNLLPANISALEPALTAASQQLQLSIAPKDTQQLLRYLALLVRWNATYNLTAVRDPGDMLVQHLLDCLAVVSPFRRALGTGPAPILDVGSGGGLPGVVLAAMNPEWQVECVDAVGKKAAFVRQVAAELGLRNLTGTHARVEQVKGKYRLITSRAFASLALFVDLTRDHLSQGGVWAALKGKVPHDEIAGLPASVDVFHVEQLHVPGLEAERCLVWMRPTN